MAGIDFGAVRGEVGMDAVLELLGFVPRQRRGDQVRGPCPLHKPTSPVSRSFSAHLTKQAYRCFHCGSSGNQLDLWAAATGQPLYQAAISLCDKLHRAVPWSHRRPSSGRKPAPAS
jgi:DNA primase